MALLTACAAPPDLDGADGPEGDSLEVVEQAIIGGSTPVPGSQPWLARITRDGAHHCGGSLLNRSWVLTAGHCVSGIDRTRLRVIMGDHSVSTADANEQTRTVSAVHVHPDYRRSGPSQVPQDDVALLQLSSPVWLKAGAQTVALPAGSATPLLALTAGWGRTATFETPDTLLQASLRVWSNSVCDAVPLLRPLRSGEICAGTATRGTCVGDSGGPLTYITGGRRTQSGITSWVNGSCGTDPQVYTRVSTYKSWIEGVIATPLRGNVRFRSTGALATGTLSMWCASSGEFIEAPTDVSGLELSMHCTGSVTATCTVSQWLRWINGFTLNTGSGPYALPFYRRSASISTYVPAGGTASFECAITDTP